MDREDFLFALREQYAEEIHEAYLECEHQDGNVVDHSKLNEILNKMMKTARVDGLAGEDFMELVTTTLEDDVCSKLELHAPMHKAA